MMCGLCSSFGVELLTILVATFLIVWSAGQTNGKLGKIIGTIILVIAIIGVLMTAYFMIGAGCLKGKCPMMSGGNTNMSMPMQKMGGPRKMQMQQMPMQGMPNQPVQTPAAPAPLDSAQGKPQNNGQ